LADIRNDEIFITLRKNFEDLLVDEENKFVTEKNIRQKVNEIRHQIEDLNGKYNGVIRDIGRESYEIIMGISKDPYLTKLGKDINTMFSQMFTDKEGSPSVTVILDSIVKLKDAFFPSY